MLINIAIEKKHPVVDGTPVIVCGNNGYQIKFAFDEEWDDSLMKTARFAWRKEGKALYIDVPFTGDTVDVPLLTEVRYVLVGVYTDHLRTTTPARIACEYSIRCNSGEDIQEPTPEDVLIDLFNLVTAQQDAAIQAADAAAAANEGAQIAAADAAESQAAAAQSAADAFRTVGLASQIKDMNDHADLRIWTGTLEEYEAQKADLDPKILCLIADEKMDVSKEVTVSVSTVDGVPFADIASKTFIFDPTNKIVFYSIELLPEKEIQAGKYFKVFREGGYAPSLVPNINAVSVGTVPPRIAVGTLDTLGTWNICAKEGLEDVYQIVVQGWYYCDGE